VLVIPLILKPSPWKPAKWLAEMQLTPTEVKPLLGESEFEIEKQLAKLAEDIHTMIKKDE
jgi:hypothetical protein